MMMGRWRRSRGVGHPCVAIAVISARDDPALARRVRSLSHKSSTAAAFERQLPLPCSPAKAGAQSGSPPSRGNKIGDSVLEFLRSRRHPPRRRPGPNWGTLLTDDSASSLPPFQLGPGLRRGGGGVRANFSVPSRTRGARNHGRWRCLFLGPRVREGTEVMRCFIPCRTTPGSTDPVRAAAPRSPPNIDRCASGPIADAASRPCRRTSRDTSS